ncbi:hypothetical protein M988_3342 [Hafnia paralvei ATCC 29927]|nr:hypothetical protein M988_3342 [Hafnia paralvei ATCC 29927]
MGNTTISQNGITKTADSQSANLAAYANDDVIKNATGSSFVKRFVNRGDSALSHTVFRHADVKLNEKTISVE